MRVLYLLDPIMCIMSPTVPNHREQAMYSKNPFAKGDFLNHWTRVKKKMVTVITELRHSCWEAEGIEEGVIWLFWFGILGATSTPEPATEKSGTELPVVSFLSCGFLLSLIYIPSNVEWYPVDQLCVYRYGWNKQWKKRTF